MNRVAFAVLFCLLLPAARAEEQPPPRKVVEIEVRGNLRTPTATILSLIRTKVGQPFSQELWDEDWHRLTRTGLFEKIRVTPPISLGGQKLVLDLTEHPAYEDLIVKGVDEEKAAKTRETCAGFLGSLGTPSVRKSIAAAVKDLHPKAAEIELTTVCLRTHKQRVAGEEQEAPEAVQLVITVKANAGEVGQVQAGDDVSLVGLSLKEIKVALELMERLAADDFDTREKAEAQLEMLVRCAPVKMLDYETLFDACRAKNNPEVSSRLPKHVGLRASLAGHWVVRKERLGDIGGQLVILPDWTYELRTWNPNTQVVEKRGAGQYRIDQGKVVFSGQALVFLGKKEDWQATAQPKDLRLEVTLSVDGDETRSTWIRIDPTHEKVVDVWGQRDNGQ